MQQSIVRKLFRSLKELERSIFLVKKSLMVRDPIPLDQLRLVTQCELLLGKQRTLCRRLCTFVLSGDGEEIDRHVKLIDGITAQMQGEASLLLSEVEASGAL